MSDVQNEVKEVNEQEVVSEVTVVEKEGFFTKVGNGAKKVVSSKPFKIIGGILITAGSAFVGYEIGKNGSNNGEIDYDEDVDFDDYDEVAEVEDESAIAD